MIYELLLENFMYPNIAANLPRAFPRYKLSDEDYTLKLFIINMRKAGTKVPASFLLLIDTHGFNFFFFRGDP